LAKKVKKMNNLIEEIDLICVACMRRMDLTQYEPFFDLDGDVSNPLRGTHELDRFTFWCPGCERSNDLMLPNPCGETKPYRCKHEAEFYGRLAAR
jgi:hypothetical protein